MVNRLMYQMYNQRMFFYTKRTTQVLSSSPAIFPVLHSKYASYTKIYDEYCLWSIQISTVYA